MWGRCELAGQGDVGLDNLANALAESVRCVAIGRRASKRAVALGQRFSGFGCEDESIAFCKLVWNGLLADVGERRSRAVKQVLDGFVVVFAVVGASAEAFVERDAEREQVRASVEFAALELFG